MHRDVQSHLQCQKEAQKDKIHQPCTQKDGPFLDILGLYPKSNSHTSEHWDTWCYRNPEPKLILHPQSPTAPCFTCFTSMQKERKTALPLLFQNPCKPKFPLEPSESGSLCRELAVPWDSYPKELEELFQQPCSDFRCSYCHRSWLLM